MRPGVVARLTFWAFIELFGEASGVGLDEAIAKVRPSLRISAESSAPSTATCSGTEPSHVRGWASTKRGHEDAVLRSLGKRQGPQASAP